jgi:hypothetical protein
LIQLRPFGEHIVVPIHYVPEARQLAHTVLGNMSKIYEGIDA